MGMYPRGTALVGAGVDAAGLLDRASQVLADVARAGVADLSFGAGAARSIPASVPRHDGLAQLGSLFSEIAALARARGVSVHIENIASPDSNVFNSVSEIADFIAEHQLEGVGILFDLRQAALQADDPLAQASAQVHRLTHVHIPAEGMDEQVGALLKLLTDAGYQGRLSIEPPDLVISPAAIDRARHVRRVLGR